MLLAIAGVLGWLASIILRQDDGWSIAFNVLVAVAGALVFALLSSSEGLERGISAEVLLVGAAGALLFVGGYAASRRRMVR